MASMRNHRLKSKYGITKAQWDVLFIAQGSRCANLACRSKTPGSRQGWHTDHDHELRKGDPKFIRGILCHPCNVALGHAKDCAQILLGLINYLHFHKLEQ
jgi:hypothetical protein